MVCLFCEISQERVIASNELAYAVRDGFPVTTLHSLVIPKSHKTDYFALSKDELLACDQLLRSVRDEIQTLDSSVTGFNIGLNSGESAGQTVFHCHFHLIPRRNGDVAQPRGGVRHLIPGKGCYDPSEGK
jgi:diadenosine tetraphosphate (Ap4A) HIT family hydrolase